MLPYQKAQVSFRKLDEIGQEGQNSKVYRAHDEFLNAEMVIKEVEKKDGFSADEYFVEAQTLYKSAHPNVVQINYACEDDDNVYVSSPYYSSGSLKKLMAKRFLTVREIIRYSVHVLNGLHNVHSKGLIHFDIKPDNILISERNEALLADFGLSKPMNKYGQASQPYLYQKQWPPEAFGNTGAVFDNRFDIYQIGLTMYRMCVGDECFNAQYSKYRTIENFANDIIAGKFPDRNIYPLHIPKKLRTTINKCLKPNPGDRFGSAVEIVNSLADISGSILDWQFVLKGDALSWEKNESGVVKRLSVDGNRSALAYTQNGSAAPRRIAKYCKANITDTEIIGFLEK